MKNRLPIDMLHVYSYLPWLIFYRYIYIYIMKAVLKVETDIIASITASQTGRAVKLVIMYVNIFKTGIIVFISDFIFNISQFLHMRVTDWPNIFVDQGQFSDPDFISSTHQRENVQLAVDTRLLGILVREPVYILMCFTFVFWELWDFIWVYLT